MLPFYILLNFLFLIFALQVFLVSLVFHLPETELPRPKKKIEVSILLRKFFLYTCSLTLFENILAQLQRVNSIVDCCSKLSITISLLFCHFVLMEKGKKSVPLIYHSFRFGLGMIDLIGSQSGVGWAIGRFGWGRVWCYTFMESSNFLAPSGAQ